MACLLRAWCLPALLATGCSAWIDTDDSRLLPSDSVAPTCASGCDDGVACTLDACVGGQCIHTPDSSLCAQGSCDVQQGCLGTPPCAGQGCACQGSDCPAGQCSQQQVDRDGDGRYARVAGEPMCGDDCADDDPNSYPGAPEVCDDRDNDCNGMVDDACVPAASSCQGVRPLTLSAGRAQVNGSLGPVGTRFETTCGTTAGRGAIFQLDIPELADIELDTSGSEVPTVIAVGTTCAASGGFNLACAGTVKPNVSASRLVLHRYDPTTQARSLYVLVDTTGGRATGKFVLNVKVLPAVSYSCNGQPLEMSLGGTLVGFMSNSGSLTGGCMLPVIFNPPEVVVRYSAMGGPKSIRCQASSTSFAPGLYAQTLCGLGLTEVDCDQAGGNAGTASIDVDVAANESAFIVIDNGRNGAKYELTCQDR